MTDEPQIVNILAKILTENGEIVKLNNISKQAITIDGKDYRPDLFTIDKNDNVKTVYEIKLKVTEEGLIALKNISEVVETVLVVSDAEREKAMKIIDENKLKIKKIISFSN